jgi:predicted enzyme related to lactoylglutathione lyase
VGHSPAASDGDADVQRSPGSRSGFAAGTHFVEGGRVVARVGIAKLWKPVINVTDLDAGEAFWSAVSGLLPQGRHGQFSILNAEDGNRDGWILLQLVPSGQISANASTHLDFRVDDVAGAAEQIEEIGGVMIRPPGLYAPDGQAVLEWAVMQDPFGNEFCIIRWPLE